MRFIPDAEFRIDVNWVQLTRSSGSYFFGRCHMTKVQCTLVMDELQTYIRLLIPGHSIFKIL